MGTRARGPWKQELRGDGVRWLCVISLLKPSPRGGRICLSRQRSLVSEPAEGALLLFFMMLS